MSALAPKLIALIWLSYFASGESVIAELAAAHAGQPALHVEAALSAAAPDAPTRLLIDLHPEFGMRIADERGGRWVVRRGRVVAGTTLPPPGWLPDLEIVGLRHDVDFRAWLGVQGIDASANELARCGDADCYVLGSRQSLAQLWVEKRALEVRRVVLPGRGSLDLEEWRAFGQIRFPARLDLSRDGTSATIAIESVAPAARLSAGDFSASWVQAVPSAGAP